MFDHKINSASILLIQEIKQYHIQTTAQKLSFTIEWLKL